MGGCPHPALLMLELEQGTKCLSLWFPNPECRAQGWHLSEPGHLRSQPLPLLAAHPVTSWASWLTTWHSTCHWTWLHCAMGTHSCAISVLLSSLPARHCTGEWHMGMAGGGQG